MSFVRTTLALVILHAVATVSSASVIVANGPATDTSFRIGGPNSQVEAVVWFQAAATDVAIDALIGSLDGNSRDVDVYLEENVTGNVIASTKVTIGSFSSSASFTPVTLFTGLSLPGFAYRLTLFNTDTSGNTNVRWSVGSATTNTVVGAFAGSEYADTPDSDVSFPYLSTFSPSTEPLGFSVTGHPVPEPSSIVLTLSAVVAVGVFGRCHRKESGNRNPQRSFRWPQGIGESRPECRLRLPTRVCDPCGTRGSVFPTPTFGQALSTLGLSTLAERKSRPTSPTPPEFEFLDSGGVGRFQGLRKVAAPVDSPAAPIPLSRARWCFSAAEIRDRDGRRQPCLLPGLHCLFRMRASTSPTPPIPHSRKELGSGARAVP